MRPAVRRILKRLGIAVAVIVLGLGVTAAVIYWRAGRTPDWYAQARQIAGDNPEADATFNRNLAPLQNWAARTSAGDLDAKPADQKRSSLTLTETQINALLAKGLDSVPGPLGTPRIRLTPGQIDLAVDSAEYGRTVGVSLTVEQAADGPAVRLAGVRVGEQPVPLGLLSGAAAKPLRAALADPSRRPKANRIDEHDLTNARLAGAYYARLLLDVLNGQAVTPLAFLPGSPRGDDLVVTKITALDVSAGSITVNFRTLEPNERAAVVAGLDAPLPQD